MVINVKIKRLLVSLVISAGSLAGALPVSAADWQFAGWNGGGAYPAIVADPQINGRFYMLSDVAGL